MKLIQPESPPEIETARQLFEEYAAWLGIDLCFQGFDEELADLPGDYAPPSGCLFLAFVNERLAGCAALRKIGAGVCEMKRLFVRPQFRGQGLGRDLTEAIIAEARRIGYQRMRLDTLPAKMQTAVHIYESLGFKKIASYYNNPVEGATFLELVL